MIGRIIIALFVLAALYLYAFTDDIRRTSQPEPAPTPVIQPEQPSLTSAAWSFSKVVLAAAPGLAIVGGIPLLYYWMRSKREIEMRRAMRPIPEGVERLSLNAGSYRAPNIVREDAPALPALDVTPALPNVIDMTEVLGRWQPSQESILLGLGPGGQPITSPVKRLCHTALVGPTGYGKSNLMRMLLAQLLATGAQVVLVDPHWCDVDPATGEDWRPIKQRLAMAPAYTPGDIRHTLQWFMHELNARLEKRRNAQPYGGPLFLAADELPSITRDVKEASDSLARIWEQGRKVNMLFIGAAHDVLVETLGTKGAVRECLRTCYYLGGDPTSGRLLLDMQGRIDDSALGEGIAYLRSPATPTAQRVRVPLASNDALYTLLETTAKPERNQIEIAPEPVSMALQSPTPPDPTAARILAMFRQGCEIAEIVRTIDPEAKTGARYQKRSSEVQAVLRDFVRPVDEAGL